ncbi:phosphatidylglycerophosphate synthase [Mesoplasma florum L1]|uniref:CDP-diacylglycerol--glycerol-3-phosphate 3-phosphatidyltransferase n=1 Tax=Mesoplasma florum (strain ATCC 33453 / NBRC 100688 / NCTC 11704 / L1) TaxID=265311 RepID=Q6F0F4_MESFL|nr:CDP-diacylglycerol--glycerol-3-phosphate 3-phosphatidyltransferase [Mesoplasma florum]AAT76019.1 phosphatidylglycerophosphate synthase [Mesoplasma florum L1]ATI73614.1 CDP-diacylglycerol--glycerol-3-phosphate 3-phosphatidyltransferase [Mesoplasma florum]AVN59265.1 CDP-diacylglycerol--glycerol-3-phosphate 3-phosphatidyltransferase [Mesoplasma florum]AVN62007.1 CDP-diacylglycerol--glycerol-3-phosphate 3-phosphatidyltransferase [Mesoplasma florum]
MKQKQKLNLPNWLTLIRLLLVPVVVMLVISNICDWDKSFIIGTDTSTFHITLTMLLAGIVFIVASFTDFLDGYLARKNNQVTEFGKFFDPIADKLLVNATLILFASSISIIPVWVTLVLILRDIFVDFIRMILSSKNITLSAGIFGKLKTVFQMIGLSILFFFSSFTLNIEVWQEQLILIPMYIAVAFSLYSGLDYFLKARKNLF